MKNLIVLTLVILGFAAVSHAQRISPNAIGLRLGDSDGFGAEISYQRALGMDNRLEVDFGWRDNNGSDGVKGVGLYQWVFPFDGNFNWFVGAGGGFGYVNVDLPGGGSTDDAFFLIAGDIGIEYNFDFPLLLSLDMRPEIGFGDDAFDNDDLDFDIALSIRYQF